MRKNPYDAAPEKEAAKEAQVRAYPTSPCCGEGLEEVPIWLGSEQIGAATICGKADGYKRDRCHRPAPRTPGRDSFRLFRDVEGWTRGTSLDMMAEKPWYGDRGMGFYVTRTAQGVIEALSPTETPAAKRMAARIKAKHFPTVKHFSEANNGMD